MWSSIKIIIGEEIKKIIEQNSLLKPTGGVFVKRIYTQKIRE